MDNILIDSNSINFLENKRVLITGGAGFIGSTLIRKIILGSKCNKIFNLDKLSYASDLSSIKEIEISNPNLFKERYQFLKADLSDYAQTMRIISESKPDIIFH